MKSLSIFSKYDKKLNDLFTKGSYNAIKRNRRIVMIMITVVGIVLLLLLQTLIQQTIAQNNASRRGMMLSDRVTMIINQIQTNNKQDEETLKRMYLRKAHNMAEVLFMYNVDLHDVEYMRKFAKLNDVDTLDFFNEQGVIFAGSEPQDFGVTMNDGKQIAFFKPMLKNKNLELAQPVTPNTKEGKLMMYAMVWSVDKSFLVEVGVDATRYWDESDMKTIAEMSAAMPMYYGTQIIVADEANGKVLGATNTEYNQKYIKDLGLVAEGTNFDTMLGPDEVYVTQRVVDGLIIMVIQDKTVMYSNIPPTIAIILTFMLLFLSISYAIIKKLNVRLEAARRLAEEAKQDVMTGCNSRRVYENDLEDLRTNLDAHADLVYVALDINGLKTANDTMGHEAGDELIIGSSDCIKHSFEKYGKVYRTGGDEFVAIISATDDELTRLKIDFENKCNSWHGFLVNELSISSGYAPLRELLEEMGLNAGDSPADAVAGDEAADQDKNTDVISILTKRADKRMYECKEAYYKRTGKERRHH